MQFSVFEIKLDYEFDKTPLKYLRLLTILLNLIAICLMIILHVYAYIVVFFGTGRVRYDSQGSVWPYSSHVWRSLIQGNGHFAGNVKKYNV